MTTKRTPLERTRRAVIDGEALALFVELEKTPKRQRETPEFRAQSRELARRLALHDEWFFSRCDVLDRTTKPSHPVGYAARDAWFKCRAMREQLLAAAGL